MAVRDRSAKRIHGKVELVPSLVEVSVCWTRLDTVGRSAASAIVGAALPNRTDRRQRPRYVIVESSTGSTTDTSTARSNRGRVHDPGRARGEMARSEQPCELSARTASRFDHGGTNHPGQPTAPAVTDSTT